MVTVSTLITVIRRHLQEDSGFSSGLWSLPEILAYMNDAQNEFAIRTGLVKEVTPVRGFDATGAYADPPYAIDVERISYNGRKLYKQTKQELDWQKADWQLDTARNPKRYHRDGLPSHQFRVWPMPTIHGSGYSLTTGSIATGLVRQISGSTTYTSASPLGTVRGLSGVLHYVTGSTPPPTPHAPDVGILRQMVGTSKNFMVIHDVLPSELITLNDALSVPDAFSRYVSYGVLQRAWAKEGEGQDVRRSQYCRARFLRGVQLARRLVYGSGAKING